MATLTAMLDVGKSPDFDPEVLANFTNAYTRVGGVKYAPDQCYVCWAGLRCSAEAGIVKILMGEVDKQHVPTAQLITNNPLFHAALWHHGYRRTAAVLQVLYGVFSAFDSAHLCPSFRDYCCDRGRKLLYLILGPELHDLTKLQVSLGTKVKSCGNLSTALIYRILSNLDARQALLKKLGTWFRERAVDSNDLEGMFSELTRRAGGYMPNFRDAFNAMKVAERATRAWWAGSWLMHVSRRKNYTVDQSEQTRDPWNSGWRVYEWWPLERFTVGAKPRSSGGTAQMLRKGVKHTEQKQKAVRQQHKFANRA